MKFDTSMAAESRAGSLTDNTIAAQLPKKQRTDSRLSEHKEPATRYELQLQAKFFDSAAGERKL